MAPEIPPDIPNIFMAASKNDVRALEIAVPYYGVNARDETLMTALHHAAVALAFEAVEFLLAQPGIDAALCDVRDWNACAAVMFSCSGAEAERMTDLLETHCFAKQIAWCEQEIQRDEEFRRKFKVLDGGKADKPKEPNPFGS